MADIGIDLDEDEVETAFRQLDKDGSDSIDIEEFTAWWKSNTKAGINITNSSEVANRVKELEEALVEANTRANELSTISGTIRAIYRKHDPDNNGIDQSQLKKLMSDAGVILSSQDVETSFQLLDADNSGHIDIEEFTVWWKTSLKNGFINERDERVEVLEKALIEANSNISKESSATTVDATVRAVFKKYDTDKSGNISVNELGLVMADIGIELDEEQLENAFEELDRDDSGSIEIEEFARWWHSRTKIAFANQFKDSKKSSSSSGVSSGGSEDLESTNRVLLKRLKDEVAAHEKKEAEMEETDTANRLLLRRLQKEQRKTDKLSSSAQSSSSHPITIDATVRAVFRKYDVDESGSIEASELKSVMSDIGIDLNEEELETTFAELDTDGSGTVEIDEFAVWWNKRAKSAFTSDFSKGVLEASETKILELEQGLEKAESLHQKLKSDFDINNELLSKTQSELKVFKERAESQSETLEAMADESTAAKRIIELQTEVNKLSEVSSKLEEKSNDYEELSSVNRLLTRRFKKELSRHEKKQAEMEETLAANRMLVRRLKKEAALHEKKSTLLQEAESSSKMLANQLEKESKKSKKLAAQAKLATTQASSSPASSSLSSSMQNNQVSDVPPAIDATARAVFKKYDIDNSGTISANELRLVMADVGIILNDQELDASFKELDTDGSGYIEIEEFSAWWTSRTKAAFKPLPPTTTTHKQKAAGSDSSARGIMRKSASLSLFGAVDDDNGNAGVNDDEVQSDDPTELNLIIARLKHENEDLRAIASDITEEKEELLSELEQLKMSGGLAEGYSDMDGDVNSNMITRQMMDDYPALDKRFRELEREKKKLDNLLKRHEEEADEHMTKMHACSRRMAELTKSEEQLNQKRAEARSMLNEGSEVYRHDFELLTKSAESEYEIAVRTALDVEQEAITIIELETETLKASKRERGEHPELVEAAVDGAGGGPAASEEALQAELTLLKETEEEQNDEFDTLTAKYATDEAELNRIDSEIEAANEVKLKIQTELDRAKKAAEENSSSAETMADLESRLRTSDAALRMLLEEKEAAKEDIAETSGELEEVKSSLRDIMATVEGVELRISMLKLEGRRFEAQQMKALSIQTAKTELTNHLQLATESRKEQDKKLERESGLLLTDVTAQLEKIYQEMEQLKLDVKAYEEEGMACLGMAEQIRMQIPPISKEYFELDNQLNRIRMLNPNVVGASKAEQELVNVKADLELASSTISQLETLLASERFKNAKYKEEKEKLMKMINEKQTQLNDVRERSTEEGSVSQALLSMIHSLSELPPKVQKYVIDSISGEVSKEEDEEVKGDEDGKSKQTTTKSKRSANIKAGNKAYEEASEQIRSELQNDKEADQSEAAAELAGLMSAYNKLWAKFNAEISAHESLRENNEALKEEIAELRGAISSANASIKSLKNQVEELNATGSEERKLWEDAELTWHENADALELENNELVTELEELRISAAKTSAQASKDQAEILKLRNKLKQGGEAEVEGNGGDGESVKSLEQAVEDAKVAEAETVNRLNAEIRSLTKELAHERGRASAAEISLEEQRALLEARTEEADQELVKLKQQQADLAEVSSALKRRETQGEAGLLRQRIAELESETRLPAASFASPFTDIEESMKISETDEELEKLLSKDGGGDGSGDGGSLSVMRDKLMEERKTRQEMVQTLGNYKQMLGKMHDRMLIMSRVFAAKESGRKKVETLESERLEMLLHETSSSMSKEDMARLIVYHKDLTTKALYDSQLASEKERSVRSKYEAQSIDMKNLQKDLSRLNETLLHLQMERVEAKKSEDKALKSLKEAELNNNDLSSKYAEAVLQTSQFKEELEQMHKQVHENSLSQGNEISDLRFALSASKTHIRSMEKRINELIEHKKSNNAEGEASRGASDWVEVKEPDTLEKDRLVAKLETQVSALASERTKLVHALDTAKSHIIKLTTRLSLIQDGNSHAKNSENEGGSPHTHFMKSSMENISPGEAARFKEQQAKDSKTSNQERTFNPLQEENSPIEEHERSEGRQQTRPSFFESFFGYE